MARKGSKEPERETNVYRLEVRDLPRDISQKLELLKQEVWVERGKKVSKSALVVEILRDFFDRKG